MSPSATHCPQAMAVTCMLPSATCYHHSHALPTATWCPQVIPITCVSPLTVRHHRLHVTISCMVPPSSAHHLHIAVACGSPFALPSATQCPQAMPITHTSPSTACHRWPHSVPKQCPSPACRHCLRITICITIGHMVPTSNACYPHIVVAVDVSLPQSEGNTDSVLG